jgi:hypothetical protein
VCRDPQAICDTGIFTKASTRFGLDSPRSLPCPNFPYYTSNRIRGRVEKPVIKRNPVLVKHKKEAMLLNLPSLLPRSINFLLQ